jgi:hypothetical protein
LGDVSGVKRSAPSAPGDQKASPREVRLGQPRGGALRFQAQAWSERGTGKVRIHCLHDADPPTARTEGATRGGLSSPTHGGRGLRVGGAVHARPIAANLPPDRPARGVAKAFGTHRAGDDARESELKLILGEPHRRISLRSVYLLSSIVPAVPGCNPPGEAQTQGPSAGTKQKPASV